MRYGLEQECYMPYWLEQNGIVERFLKKCVWQQPLWDWDHAFGVIAGWMDPYHWGRPHQALGYLTPREFRKRLAA